MSTRILLLGGNYFPELTGIGKYTGEMVDGLSERGFQCTIITTYPYYPEWKIKATDKNRSFWFKKGIRIPTGSSHPITIIRCPHYVPAKPSGLKRIISDFSFFFSASLVIISLLFRQKYNYVVSISPPFQPGLLAVLYKAIKGARFIYHIQDLQIDAAKELGMIRSSVLINILLKTEHFILKHADLISTISEGMKNKVFAKCNKAVVLFPNWVDVESFYPVEEKNNLKEGFGFTCADKVILYSGAIGEKQGLEAIIHSAVHFRNDEHIKFVICGSGPYKEKLRQLKSDLHLHNLVFFPLQPAENFNSFLNIADVHLVLQKATAKDLVMPSKLTTILSAGGLALITADPGTSLFDIINENKIGILIKAEDQMALNDAIQQALSGDHFCMKNNARKYAVNHLSIDKILGEYITHMN